MKLHKDGTIEGTPEEISQYNKLVRASSPNPFSLTSAQGTVSAVGEAGRVVTGYLSTARLIDLLNERTGVRLFEIDGENKMTISAGDVAGVFEGPAKVLFIEG